MKNRIFALVLGLCAGGPALAAAKSRKHTKPRVLLFDPLDPKKRPTFEFRALSPQKVSVAPILFTTVAAPKASDSDEPGDVSVTEKALMLDEGKVEKPKKNGTKAKAPESDGQ